jgi:hypothetical protein
MDLDRTLAWRSAQVFEKDINYEALSNLNPGMIGIQRFHEHIRQIHPAPTSARQIGDKHSL